jgi:excisionase family DNA binding protein
MNTLTHASHTEFIDARRFEERYSLSRRTFFAWIAEGKIEAYRPSKRKTLVKRSDVDRIIESSRSVSHIDTIVNETLRELRVGK